MLPRPAPRTVRRLALASVVVDLRVTQVANQAALASSGLTSVQIGRRLLDVEPGLLAAGVFDAYVKANPKLSGAKALTFDEWAQQQGKNPDTYVKPKGNSAADYLRTNSLSRLVLDNIRNIQASWVTQGGRVGQLSLAYGANDMGSVMIEENVVRAAGASYCMDEVEIVRNVENAGFAAKRRNMHYEILGDPIFREREVPRMLSLSTARAEGDTSVPDELKNYPARSRAGKQQRAFTN